MIHKKLFLTTAHFAFLVSIVYLSGGFSHITPATATAIASSNLTVAALIPTIDIAPTIQTLPSVKVAVAKPTPAAISLPTQVGKPRRLIIPSININTYIEHIGLTQDGAVGVPEGAVNVSWFSAGPRPGQQGSAVISGHSGIWKDGTHSIFDPLPNVKPGEIIYVKDDKNNTLSFTVREIRVFGKNDTVPEIFNKSDSAYLNIITCHGDYLPKEKTYSKRLVVFAEALTN